MDSMDLRQSNSSKGILMNDFRTPPHLVLSVAVKIKPSAACVQYKVITTRNRFLLFIVTDCISLTFALLDLTTSRDDGKNKHTVDVRDMQQDALRGKDESVE